jgi:sarcosine oxidase subunit beta
LIDAIIIGGGVMGLSVGYSLLKKGLKTMILEGEYMNAGSTGRNMGILKERIPHALLKGNVEIIRLAEKSLSLHRRLPSQLGYNTFYRKSGCLIIARDETEWDEILKRHSQYKKLGLHEAQMNAEQIENRWPYINSHGLVGGMFNHNEAIMHPFALTWGLLESIKKLGGRIYKQNWVKEIRKTQRGYTVVSDRGEFEGKNVVVACGARSPELLEGLGFDIPLTPWRKEVLISEPVRPYFGPVIEGPSNNYQVGQTMRGEILGTMGFMKPSFDLSECTSEFLYRFAEETVNLIPSFKNLRVIRQWVGICDGTPDLMPLVGQLDDGLQVMCGFYDYGITLAPAISKLITDFIVEGELNSLLKAFDPHRFG